MFDLTGVANPMLYGNYQRNSYVPLPINAEGKKRWSKDYTAVDPDSRLTPKTLLLHSTHLGIQSNAELWLFETDGSFKRHYDAYGPAPVIFGKDGIAYVRNCQLMDYIDYNGKVLTEDINLDGEWTVVKLLRPLWEEFISVVQFTGGPERRPREYTIGRKKIGKSREVWGQDDKGTIDHAFLTKDEKTMVILQGEDVSCLDAATGKKITTFKTGIAGPFVAAIDRAGNLLCGGRMVKDENTHWVLLAMTLDGSLRWECHLEHPLFAIDTIFNHQPPACGNDGRVYIVDDGFMKCMIAGDSKWQVPVIGRLRTLLTVSMDNSVILLNGPRLQVLDADGRERFTEIIPDESFETPAVIDEKGRIYAAGQKALYCFE
ncbi:MAG: PQQ-like beta-propeller repeat protein [Chitinispirillaceae bacterium]|nr:PQQ-like beta-propeller repeat protein [Chitinispirillaceae bacterium]